MVVVVVGGGGISNIEEERKNMELWRRQDWGGVN